MATVTFDKRDPDLPRVRHARRRQAQPRDRRRRVPGPRRPVRLRQVHLAAHARRPRRGQRGPRSSSATATSPTCPPKDRDIAMVFQNYALYPHMTVAENMGFALKIAGVTKEERAKRVLEAAKLLDLEEYLDRKPKALSGGQRQRVAMGRAIVRQPQVFLMDEPLSNLDAKLRVQTRTQIASLQRRLGVTTVYVTHDQIEAMTMGDRVAVLKDGVLQQVDTPRNLYDNPNNVFVAGFIGSPAMNLFEADVADGGVKFGDYVDPARPRRPAGQGRQRQDPDRRRSPRGLQGRRRGPAGRGRRRRGARRRRLPLRHRGAQRRAPADRRPDRRPDAGREGFDHPPRGGAGQAAPVLDLHRRAADSLIRSGFYRPLVVPPPGAGAVVSYSAPAGPPDPCWSA